MIFLTSCATLSDPFQDIQAGMTAAEVERILGEPDDRLSIATQERWRYHDEKIVIFEHGKVVGLINDDTAPAVGARP